LEKTYNKICTKFNIKSDLTTTNQAVKYFNFKIKPSYQLRKKKGALTARKLNARSSTTNKRKSYLMDYKNEKILPRLSTPKLITDRLMFKMKSQVKVIN